MTDVVDRATRSRMMSGIRARDTKPEMIVRRHLHGRGFRYRLAPKNLPGRPDVVLPRYGTVVFVHGCFWHRHPGCKYAATPAANADFWAAKFTANVTRDARVTGELRAAGWQVLVVWECETTPERLARLCRQIRSNISIDDVRTHDE